MDLNLSIDELSPRGGSTEIVERKGRGHPDTICDALAEELSRTLCREYRDRFGAVLHHNVDKALLRGGRSSPRFGGGQIDEAMDIYLSGRAVTEFRGTRIPVDEIVTEVTRNWLGANLLSVDVDRHVRIHNLVRPGSVDLVDMFERGKMGAGSLSNDTSVGVGYAPLSPLEALVLETERRLNGRDRRLVHPAWGEDIKVMASRMHGHVDVTVACAIVDRHVESLGAYEEELSDLEDEIRAICLGAGFDDVSVAVNAADDRSSGAVYLTVTGTSAEAGDDGEVGRGNRANGLITPFRPMSLEALAGKNPVSHVGKLYNVTAREIAQRVVAELAGVEAVECYLLSRIGAPVTQPVIAEIRGRTGDGSPMGDHAAEIEGIVSTELGRIPGLADRFIAGDIEIF